MSAKLMYSGLLFVLLTTYISKVICWDYDCGRTKGCFPDGPADYLVTWQDRGTYIRFTLEAQMDNCNHLGSCYIAIAFSDDHRMGDDSVVACINNTAQSSYNDGTDNIALSPSSYRIFNVSVPYINYCSFNREISDSDSRFFDLNNDYYIQLVTGRMTWKNGIYKMDKHDKIPWLSAHKVDFQSNATVAAYKLNSPLVKAHGIMMVLGWILFSLIGVMTARYNKDMLPETKLFGSKVWFQVHRTLMVAVAVCVVVGFITIFVEIRGYSQVTPGEKGFVHAHPVLGIVISCLVLIHAIGALFRPGPDHKFRWIFNLGHLGLGTIVPILALVTIFFGYFAARSDLPTSAAYVTSAHMAFLIFFFVFIEVRHRIEPAKKDTANGKFDKGDMKSEGLNEKQSVWTDPVITLLLFSIATFGFALAVLVIIATG